MTEHFKEMQKKPPQKDVMREEAEVGLEITEKAHQIAEIIQDIKEWNITQHVRERQRPTSLLCFGRIFSHLEVPGLLSTIVHQERIYKYAERCIQC